MIIESEKRQKIQIETLIQKQDDATLCASSAYLDALRDPKIAFDRHGSHEGISNTEITMSTPERT